MGLRTRYRDYLACCNDRRWDELAGHVHDAVRVNGRVIDRADYVAAIADVVSAFDDYRWHIERDVVEDDTIAVVLTDTGTHTGTWHGIAPTNRSVHICELASYRFENDRVAEVWSCGDDLAIAAQLGAKLTSCG